MENEEKIENDNLSEVQDNPVSETTPKSDPTIVETPNDIEYENIQELPVPGDHVIDSEIPQETLVVETPESKKTEPKKPSNKREFTEFAFENKFDSEYSGEKRTMFLHPQTPDADSNVFNGLNMSFKVKIS